MNKREKLQGRRRKDDGTRRNQIAAPAAERMPEDSGLIYGRRGIAELLLHQPKRIDLLYLAAGEKVSQSIDGLAEAARKSQIKIQIVEPEELDRLSQGGVHQGAAARLVPAQAVALDDIVSRSRAGRGIVLALDQITDPHNFGAILRTAEASGVDGIIAPRSGSASVTPVVRKSSAGASELVPIAYVSNLSQALERLKREGFWIAGTALGGGSKMIYQTEIPLPCVLVIGAEGRGIRRLTAEQCDLLLEIPMQGAIQSLNVGQAAAVVLFELVRRSLERAGSSAGSQPSAAIRRDK